ncbi:MAG: LamG domain-containing protein, partial [Dolichospermum sp.]
PSISTTTTYYVDVTYNGCTSTSRTAVVANVASAVATPTITASGSTTICNSNSVTLTSQLSGSGNVNSGVSVNNGAIIIPDNNALDFTTKYTFESWININAYQNGTIMSKFDDDNNNRSFMINMGETGDNTKICVIQTSSGSWTNPIQWNTGYTPTLNTWTHIAVVFDGTLGSNQIKLYVNGVLYSQTTWNYTLQPNTANVYLGGYDAAGNGLNSGANSRFLNGKLDDVRFWNTARTQSEILNNKDAEIANTTGLVGYYKLNEGIGSSVTDFSSTGNNGIFSASGVTWSAPGVSYLWSPTGEQTAFINASTAGNYSVTITDVNGCSATSAPTTVTLNSGGIVANAGADQVNCAG